MTGELVPFGMNDIMRIGEAIAKSRLFGIQNVEQAVALCLIAQAEGRHPALAARDYDIIQGRPSKKAEAMLRDFLSAGGKVKWHALDDTQADATFSHPSGGSARITWDIPRAKRAQLTNPMWTKYPRSMLRSRVVSEGVRTVWPMATGGLYVPEEVVEFRSDPIDITPPKPIEAATAKPEPLGDLAVVDNDGEERTFQDPGIAIEAMILMMEACADWDEIMRLLEVNEALVGYLSSIGRDDLRQKVMTRAKELRADLRRREQSAVVAAQTGLGTNPEDQASTRPAGVHVSREIVPQKRNGKTDWEGWMKQFSADLHDTDGTTLPFLLGDNKGHIGRYKAALGTQVADALEALIKLQWERIG